MDDTMRADDPSPLLHRRAAEALTLAAAPLVRGPRPVAVVLADGTVRRILRLTAPVRSRAAGLLSGGDWTFRWELRSWSGSRS